MVVLTIIVAVLAVTVLVQATTLIRHTARFNRHCKMIENNLDLIESINHSMHFEHEDTKTFRDTVSRQRTQMFECILANGTGLQEQLVEQTMVTDWDLHKHNAADVLMDLISYLGLDWQRQSERVIFSKREDRLPEKKG